MLSLTLFVLFALICSPLQTNAQNVEVEQALESSKIAISTVQMTLEDKLPPNTEAHELGNEILATLQRSLKICDENLRKDLQFVTYNICVSSNKGLAMASLGELVGEQWAKSGASRPGLFC